MSAIATFIHFHRSRLIGNTLALAFYGGICYKAKTSKSEVVRMGVAGSMAHGTVEALFHFVDTVNIKSKAQVGNATMVQMVRRIYLNEGVLGFGRGIGAACYGNYSSGLLYFTLYKYLKTNMPELGGFRCFAAAFTAEIFAILY
jgi:hypothetical protein